MLNGSTKFYLKTLAVYAVLLALLHCPSMEYEQKYDTNDQVGVAVEYSEGYINELGGGQGRKSYPYARMMNLIEQCRTLESSFHDYAHDFSSEEESSRIDGISNLRSKVVKVAQKMREEKGSFASYVADTRFENEEEETKANYLCTKGKCRYTVRGKSVLARKAPRQKASRYTGQVLNKYIERLEVIDQRLEALIEQSRLHDEAVKARSADKARSIDTSI